MKTPRIAASKTAMALSEKNQRQRGGDEGDPPGAVQPLPEA